MVDEEGTVVLKSDLGNSSDIVIVFFQRDL